LQCKASSVADKLTPKAKANKLALEKQKADRFTPEKAKVYTVVGDVIAKLVLAVVSGIAFLMVTFKLISDPSWPLAFAETVFAGALTIVFKHYFPEKDVPKNRRSRKPKPKQEPPPQ
jgi:hypothetical protein